MNSEFVEVATLGKSVGLKGYVKLYNKSDFPQQFKKNSKFFDKDGNEFVIKDFNKLNSSVIFFGYENIDLCKVLTNKTLYTTKQATREKFRLKKDEFFYFDIIGLEVVENDLILGVVNDIIDSTKDYLLEIITDNSLTDLKLPKMFYIPYIDNFIVDVKLEQKRIFVKNSKAILENS